MVYNWVYIAFLHSDTFGWDDITEEFLEDWVFQQDTAPGHKAKETQQWLRDHFPEFTTTKQWPPYSPDLNPLDYSIWGYLESKACEKPHKTIKSLKRAIKKAWKEMPDEMVERVVDSWPASVYRCGWWAL